MYTNNNYTDRYQASNLSLNFYSELNPLISKSDKNYFSIKLSLESKSQVTRIKEMISN